MGSLLAHVKQQTANFQTNVYHLLGAGSAGCGIAEAIIAQMVSEGISDEQALSRHTC
ncbi:hypothetical protein OK016_01490 [Vibrio chagasii]|nr:hypothetical protein [Vibrio chagasii]